MCCWVLDIICTNYCSDRLPMLIQETTVQLADCNNQLAALPPVITTEPASFVLNLIMLFCADVARNVEGSPEHATLVQSNRKAFEQFKRAVRGTAPRFVPFEAKDRDRAGKHTTVEDADDSDEDNDNDDSGEKADNKISDAASLFSDISTGVQDYEKAMYVDAVRARIEAYVPRHGAASTSDVAGQVPDTRTAKQHTVRRKARVHQRLPDDVADAR